MKSVFCGIFRSYARTICEKRWIFSEGLCVNIRSPSGGVLLHTSQWEGTAEAVGQHRTDIPLVDLAFDDEREK